MPDLRSRLISASAKAQLGLIDELAASGSEGLAALMAFLLEQREAAPNNVAIGKSYQAIFAANQPDTITFLQTHFPQGIVPLQSERNIDYAPLQQLLAQQEFEAADRLTLQKMCELAGTAAAQRKWLYFTEVENFPAIDLHTLDALWRLHSEGKFGFSVQRDIWLNAGKNWDLFWDKIGWRNGNSWTRYPQEFTWNLSAPRGHLPLSNQLRGVRVIASLLTHPAWTSN